MHKKWLYFKDECSGGDAGNNGANGKNGAFGISGSPGAKGERGCLIRWNLETDITGEELILLRSEQYDKYEGTSLYAKWIKSDLAR